MQFDPRAAKLLQPGEHLVVGGCPGLRLVCNGVRRTWTYRYKGPDGRMKQLALGRWPAMSLAAAMARWEVLREQPAQQRVKVAADPVATTTAQAYTCRACVLDYITGHLEKNRAPEGALAARRALERVLDATPDFAALSADALTRGVAFEILEARKSTPTATGKLRSLLGGAWDYALDAGRIAGETPNWWRQVMRGRLKSKGKIMGGKHVGRKRRVLQAQEVRTLLHWLPHLHQTGQDALVLYLWTAARGVEILAMRPEHLTEERDGWWWTVPKMATKNARYEQAVDLRVPLIGRALQVVQRRLKKVGASGLLFEDVRGEQYTQHDLSTYIYNLQPYSPKVLNRQSTGGLVLPVTHWTPHNLRRTSRTLLAELGCPREIGEAILGHMPGEIEGTYNAYSYDKERRLWLGKLAKRLEGLSR